MNGDRNQQWPVLVMQSCLQPLLQNHVKPSRSPTSPADFSEIPTKKQSILCFTKANFHSPSQFAHLSFSLQTKTRKINHVGYDINSMRSNLSVPAAYFLDLISRNLIQAWVDYDSVKDLLEVRLSLSSAKRFLLVS
uniref:Legume lectin domain-containing protein n=1 Tax=Salix viminalis TaxID=40686 RepID=A0A6N2NCC1_SALVM